MVCMNRSSVFLAMVAVLAMTFQLFAAEPKGQNAFLDGLEQLENAKWADATTAFARALDEDEESARYYLARGVSRVFAEDFKAAIADFDRVLRLEPADKHAKLWKSAAMNMQGRFSDGSLIYPAATRDQYENQVQDMARKYGQLLFSRQQGDSTPEWDKKWTDEHNAAKQKFPEIARLYVKRIRGISGDMVPLMLDRANKKIAAGEFASALADLQQAAEAAPSDLRVMQARGVCNIHLGSPAAARALFVRVLTAQSSNADAWHGHALACVALGDAARANASLENAISLSPNDEARYREAFTAAANAAPVAGVPRDSIAGLPMEFNRLAATDISSEDLIKHATGVIRATNAYRLRADETHLDRRLRLEALVRDNPRSADALADLGEFLYTQAVSIRGEVVEPRAEFSTYRPQTEQTQQQELNQAEQTLASALRLEPKNVKALTYKAACSIFRLKWDDAEALLSKALDVDPSYPPLLETFAKVLDHAAGVNAAAALDLRSVKSWEDANYYYYRRPTKGEIQQAAEYERQAAAMWAMAERHLEAAAKHSAGKPEGFYYLGVLAKRRGQADAARAAFEQCVALMPENAGGWDALTECYHRAGMKVEATNAKSAASNLQHTTAGHLLRMAWGQIVRTTYKTAAETLSKAMSVDPADTRGYAYMAVIAQAKGDKPAALAWWRCAGALEEAHAQFHGVNFRSPSFEFIDPSIAGRAMAVNNRLGRFALDQDQPDAAVKAFSSNITIGARFAKMDRFTPLATSQLPDQQPDGFTNPEADTGLSLIGWSMLGLGEALMKQGKEAEAMKTLMEVRQLHTQVPMTIDHRNRLADPNVLATIAMLKPLVARKEFKKAQDIIRMGGMNGQATKEHADELRRLSNLIDKELANERMGAADREAEDARRKLLEEYERFKKEREEQDRMRRRTPPPR